MEITVKKAGRTFDITFENLPKASRDYIIAYGLKQILNDSVSAAKTQDEADGLCTKKFNALLSGDLRVQRESTGGDPIAKRAREIAEGKVKASAKFKEATAGLKSTDKAYRDILAERVASVAKMPLIVAQAEADVAAASAIDIDIDF